MWYHRIDEASSADLARADLTGELTSHRLISLADRSRIGRPTQTGLSSLDPRSGCSSEYLDSST